MRQLTLGALASLFITTLLVAQTTSGNQNSEKQKTENQKTAPTKTEKSKTAPLSVVGCVRGTGRAGDPYTIVSNGGGLYRLSGMNMREYVGHRVEVLGGTDTRRLKIVGGLYPSPNAAAQAGDMDPVRSALAAEPLATSSKSNATLPEFKVRTVRSISDSCD